MGLSELSREHGGLQAAMQHLLREFEHITLARAPLACSRRDPADGYALWSERYAPAAEPGPASASP